MADTAARLVDRLFPPVPIRQWVLTFPIEIRYRLAYDGALLKALLHTFMERLDAFRRGQAHAQGHPGGRAGGIAFLQRAAPSLNLKKQS